MNHGEWTSSKVSPRQLGQHVRETAEALQQTGEYENVLKEAEKAGDTLSTYERLIIEYAVICRDMEETEVSEGVVIEPILIEKLKNKVTNKTSGKE